MNSFQLKLFFSLFLTIRALTPQQFRRYHESTRTPNSFKHSHPVTTSVSTYFLPIPPLQVGYDSTTAKYTTPLNNNSNNKKHNPTTPFSPQTQVKKTDFNQVIEINRHNANNSVFGWRNRDANYYRVGRRRKWLAISDTSSNDDEKPSNNNNNKRRPGSAKKLNNRKHNQIPRDHSKKNSKTSRPPIIFRKKVTANLNVFDEVKSKKQGKYH